MRCFLKKVGWIEGVDRETQQVVMSIARELDERKECLVLTGHYNFDTLQPTKSLQFFVAIPSSHRLFIRVRTPFIAAGQIMLTDFVPHIELKFN